MIYFKSTYKRLLFCVLLPIGCQSQQKVHIDQSNWVETDEFSQKWYKGIAEVSSFKLKQARYGEIREGAAVLIFVTEPFSGKKQVKLDNPDNAGDAVTVMKMNQTRKFNTGIYPYSMMTSVFQPVNMHSYPVPLKVTTTSQEWCGHTFTQINSRRNGLNVQLRSYFESESDQTYNLGQVILEDQLWCWIRIDPNSLPTGRQLILPGTMFQRLRHIPLKPVEANIEIQDHGKTKTLHVDYSGIERSLKIRFKSDAPFEIISWEEEYMSGFGPSAKKLITSAELDRTMMTDYWRHNSLADSVLRDSLNLE